MAVYQVRLVNQAIALDRTISVPDDQYILDIAQEVGMRLPNGCRQGECSACIAKLLSGQIDQSEQKFLHKAELDAGYTVTCVAYPKSDCTLLTHQEQVLYQSSLYFKQSERPRPSGDARSLATATLTQSCLGRETLLQRCLTVQRRGAVR